MLASFPRWPFWTLLILLATPLQAAEDKLSQSPADTTKPAATAKPAETIKPPAASKKAAPLLPLDWKVGVSTAKITPDPVIFTQCL